MSAIKLEIISRHREHPGVIASIDDFQWVAGEAIDAARILSNDRVTLYSLDHANQRAIFTALPEGVDLSAAPFMYQTQFDRAEYLIALPYADFLRLADTIPPVSGGIACLHNIGRCGSTLLSRALNEIEGVLSLSEPDALAAFVPIAGAPRDQRTALLRACVAWLCRPAVKGANTFVALKFRNQAARIMDLYMESLPQAIHIFIYRNVISWLASFHRLRVNRGDTPTRYPRAVILAQQAAFYQCDIATFEALAPTSIHTYLSLEGRALAWIYMLERYLELVEDGADIAAIRYEDLQQDRDSVLGWLLARMGLPASALMEAKRAFESDAQAGTRFARDQGRGNTSALCQAT